jgi:hypothetical protein
MSSLIEAGMIITMNTSPPGRNAINQRSTIHQLNMYTLCGLYWKYLALIGHCCIGMPNVLAITIK